MLPMWFVLVSIGLRLTSGISYIRAVLKNRAKPNPVTWFFWGLTPVIAFAAQLSEGVGAAAWATLALGAGPLVVCALALCKNWSATHFTPSSVSCGILATVGIVLWQWTDDANLAIVFSIVADIFASVPTVIKAYYRPHTEHAPAYFISMLSMVIALLAIANWNFSSVAFPLYIFLINALIFSLAIRRP